MKSERCARRLGERPARRSTDPAFSAIVLVSFFFLAGPQTRVLRARRPPRRARCDAFRPDLRRAFVSWTCGSMWGRARGSPARSRDRIVPFDVSMETPILGTATARERLYGSFLGGSTRARLAAPRAGFGAEHAPRATHPHRWASRARFGRSHSRPPPSIERARHASAPISFKFAPPAPV